jgi:hypothetical protein
MLFFMLIPNMIFVLTETVIFTNEIAEYWPKNAIFAYPEQVDLDFEHVRSFIFKQFMHEFLAR